jgi:hypothetical protein
MVRDRDTAAREIGIVVFAALVYFGVRVIVEGGTEHSMANARRVLAVERWLGIDLEHSAQRFVLGHDVARVAGNLSYVWLHWPLLIVVMVVLFRRDRVVYVRLRRALIASGVFGLLLFWLVPTAPPRFMPGFDGTVSDAARRHYLGYPLSWANRYASMPSFHVGWTAIACLALATTLTTRRWRVVAMIPAALVALAVVTTGNHYVLDAVVGLAAALSAYALAGRRWPVAVPEFDAWWGRTELVLPERTIAPPARTDLARRGATASTPQPGLSAPIDKDAPRPCVRRLRRGC